MSTKKNQPASGQSKQRSVKKSVGSLSSKKNQSLPAKRNEKRTAKRLFSSRSKKPQLIKKKTIPKKSMAKKTKPSLRFYLITGLFFILAGGIFAYQPLLQYWQERNRTSISTAPPVQDSSLLAATKAVEPIQGKPVRIEIPSLNIDVPIADGVYNPKSKSWTLSTNKAHFALMTTMPNNQAGNTFIYGHNRKEVFSRLSKIAVGQTATVYTNNNHAFIYSFRSSYETDPNDDALFRYQGPPILTLQTCSGLWYQNRFLLTFDLIEVV